MTEASNLPQDGAGEYAYDGHAPVGCELPAGCGVSGGTGQLTRQLPGTSGQVPSVHNSQGSGPPNDDTSSQPGGDSGQGSDSPPQNPHPPVASAPELDPASLAGAVTLLLGALAVARGRRLRGTR